MESALSDEKITCNGLVLHNVWKSELMKGLVGFDYSFLFDLPKEQAALCYGCLFKSFSVHIAVAKELATVDIEEHMDLVDNLRYSYVSDNGSGSKKATRFFAFVDALSFV